MNEQEQAALKEKVAQLEIDLKLAKDNEAKAIADKTTTVEDLKSVRTAKQEVEAKLTLAESKLNPDNSSQGNVEEQVKKVLDAKDAEKLANMRTVVEQKFKQSHTEFQTENDPGGIKYAAFQSKLARMNLTGLNTEEEVWEAFNDALVILNKGKISEHTDFNPYASTPKNSSGEPRGANNNKLTSVELKLIAQLSWTEERYLKLKKSQPHYVESMLAQVK